MLALEDLIAQLLKILYDHKRFNAIYELTYHCDIEQMSLENCTLTLVTNKPIQNIKQNLFEITKKNWSITVNEKNDFIPLRKRIINNFKNTSDWQEIINYFPLAEVNELSLK